MSDHPESTGRRRGPLAEFASGKSIHVLVAMLLLFATIPAVPTGAVGDRIISAVFLLLMLLATLAVSGGRRDMAWIGSLLVAHAVITWSDHLAQFRLWPLLEYSVSAAFFGTVVVLGVLRFFRAKVVSADTIASALTTYLLIGILWLNFYELAHELAGPPGWSAPLILDGDPDLDPSIGLFYFSFTTLTTLGYGDISPVHPGIRSLAVVEAVIGQFFVGVVIARLIGMQLAGARPAAEN